MVLPMDSRVLGAGNPDQELAEGTGFRTDVGQTPRKHAHQVRLPWGLSSRCSACTALSWSMRTQMTPAQRVAVNPALPRDTFEFTPPAGAQVILP